MTFQQCHPGERANPTGGMSTFPREAWVEDALCPETDVDAFFVEKGGNGRDAYKICARCPVAVDCLRWALEHDEPWGIWGCHSPRERLRLKSKRNCKQPLDEVVERKQAAVLKSEEKKRPAAKACHRCATQFHAPGTVKYCSELCRRLTKYTPVEDRPTICQSCGVEFMASGNKRNFYCTRSCREKYYRQQKKDAA